MKRSPAELKRHRTSERERLIAERGNRCEICGNGPKTRALHVDHDHRTDVTRGLLCFRCNNVLPAWVTVEWLLSAAAYLSRANGHSVRVGGGLSG